MSDEDPNETPAQRMHRQNLDKFTAVNARLTRIEYALIALFVLGGYTNVKMPSSLPKPGIQATAPSVHVATASDDGATISP